MLQAMKSQKLNDSDTDKGQINYPRSARFLTKKKAYNSPLIFDQTQYHASTETTEIIFFWCIIFILCRRDLVQEVAFIIEIDCLQVLNRSLPTEFIKFEFASRFYTECHI